MRAIIYPRRSQTCDVAQGFILQDPDVDELLRVAKDIEGASVYPEPSYTPEQNVDLLLRTLRLMQTAMDVQFRENDTLINDFNNMREDLQVLCSWKKMFWFLLYQGRLQEHRACTMQ